MKSRSRILPVVIILGTLAACGSLKHGGGKKEVQPGVWQTTPIVIDGDSKDWPSPYPNFDAKAQIAYATSNDGKYLYITMETGDPMTQMKILKQGVTVSIDTNGNREPQMNINYPLQNENDPLDMANAGGLAKKGGIDRQTELKIAKNAKEANQFSLDGFTNCNGAFYITQATPCGLKLKLGIDEYKELVWEAMVPLKAIYGREITERDAAKPISVCFAIKAFRHPETKNNDNNTGGMNSNMSNPGNATIHGRGHSGGRNMGSPDDPKQHLYENTKTWKYFSLSFQK